MRPGNGVSPHMRDQFIWNSSLRVRRADVKREPLVRQRSEVPVVGSTLPISVVHELSASTRSIVAPRAKTNSSQTNGICERFHKTVLNEFYRVAFRKKVYRSIDQLQADLDLWIREYNEQRPHQGRWCFGKTPMQTFLDAMPMAKENMIAA